MSKSQTPYVVTDDLDLVFGMLHASNITPPTTSAVHQASRTVTSSLRAIFPQVDIISADRISGFLSDCTKQSPWPVVSLTSLLDEPVAQSSLNFSRSLKATTQKKGSLTLTDAGLLPRRAGAGDLQEQFSNVAQKIKIIDPSSDIVLADDVVFSGGTVRNIIGELRTRGINVKQVFASVALKDAIDLLKADNVEVVADHIYQTVLDEVCMRDFIVGAPGGGRNVVMPDGKYTAVPYIKPFGQIEKWASIDGNAASRHSKSCLEASAQLWDGLKNADELPVKFSNLAKPIVFCAPGEEISCRLRKFLNDGAYHDSYTNSL